MTKSMIEQARSKVPEVVAQMVAYEKGYDEGFYKEIVSECYADGTILHRDYFTVNEAELLAHIKRAKQMRCEIGTDENKITVKRELSHGRYYLVEYLPIFVEV